MVCPSYHRLHCICQGLHLGHRIHIGIGFDVNHIPKQTDFSSCVHAHHTNQVVVVQCWISVIVITPICRTQDYLIRIHNRLQFDCVVSLCACDGRAG